MSALPRVCASRTLWPSWCCARRLKKEMGLQHVSGDHNHRKQEHNCLEYTDSRKCTTGEGQEDRGKEREMDGAEDQREMVVTEASNAKMGTKTRQGHLFFPHPFLQLQYIVNHSHE